MDERKTKIFREVDYKLDRLEKIFKAIGYGRCFVVLENGEPVRIERPLQVFDLKVPEKDFGERLKTIGI